MTQGKIKRLTDRGFGFIEIDGSDKDLFFHSSELKNVEYRDLREGDMVSFDIVDSPKGQNATNIGKTE